MRRLGSIVTRGKSSRPKPRALGRHKFDVRCQKVLTNKFNQKNRFCDLENMQRGFD